MTIDMTTNSQLERHSQRLYSPIAVTKSLPRVKRACRRISLISLLADAIEGYLLRVTRSYFNYARTDRQIFLTRRSAARRSHALD